MVDNQDHITWWDLLPFEEQFNKTIDWLIADDLDTTSKHPNHLIDSEIISIYKMNHPIEKVIFLDIDGVLNVIPQGRDSYGAIFHEHFMTNFNRLIKETNAKIVISSTWRFSGLSIMREMWDFRKLAGEVIDITPSEYHIHKDILCGDTRGHEIAYWLKLNPTKQYLIIDDDIDMLDSQMVNFVKTSENSDHPDCIDVGYGLTEICTNKAIKILNGRN